ncbi:MAG: ClpXP protease specificity-enhancing factor SspB [Pseudomonadota bacterium]
MSTSRRPYLIRAIVDWAADNRLTPHLLVAADAPGVIVPLEHVKEGRITLNISGYAVQGLDLRSEPFMFSARFSGKPFTVEIPSGAVLAVFAQENGEGVVFGEIETSGAPVQPPPPAPKPGRPSGKPTLRRVK